MIYKRPGFLEVVWFGSSPNPSPLSTGDTQEDWRWGRSQKIAQVQVQDNMGFQYITIIFVADICEKHGVWLHVDAAWGGGLLMSSRYRTTKFKDIER
jgi:hypothetical protein